MLFPETDRVADGLLAFGNPFRAQTADSIRLLFVGDLMQHQAQMDAAKRPDGTYDYTSYFRQVRPEFDRADLLVGNLEVTLGGKPYRGIRRSARPTSSCTN